MIRTALLAGSLSLTLFACVDDADVTFGSLDFDLTVAECNQLNIDKPPFGSCPAANKWEGKSEADQKAMCEAVKAVALKKATNKDCADGWIFGPKDEQKKCIAAATDRKLCMVDAWNPGEGGGHPAWPTGDGFGECAQDWVIKCTDKYPATMGIGGGSPVCFVPALKYEDLPVGSWTGREVCQRLKDGKLPDKCPADICTPKPKKAKPVEKKKLTSCTATPTPDEEPPIVDGPVTEPTAAPINAHVATTTTTTDTETTVTCVDTWVDCGPDDDDCELECEACADDDTDAACVDAAACEEAIATPVAIEL